MRDWLVKKEKEKKIYPSHSENFCKFCDIGDRGIETKDEKRETKKKQSKKHMSVHIMIAGRTLKKKNSFSATR